MIIDTHCHIDLYPNPNLVIKELEKQNIITIGMTNLPSHFNMGFRHTRNLRKVRLALGMHPLMALNHSSEFPEFYRSLKLTSYIGEIGLDFSQEGIETKDIQIDSFNKILEAVSKEKKYPESTISSINFNPPEYQWKIAFWILYFRSISKTFFSAFLEWIQDIFSPLTQPW